MGEINLSEEQENKLTEMCRVLFTRNINEDPSWKNEVKIFNKHGKDYVLKGVDFMDFDETDPELFHLTLGNDGRIHWFEFCIRILTKKLRIPISREELHNSENLVDYLYEQFKISQTFDKKEKDWRYWTYQDGIEDAKLKEKLKEAILYARHKDFDHFDEENLANYILYGE